MLPIIKAIRRAAYLGWLLASAIAGPLTAGAAVAADVEPGTRPSDSRLAELLLGKPSRLSVRALGSLGRHGPIIRKGPADLHGFTWNFGPQNDRNRDFQPDGWKRREGRGYPHYVKIAIATHNVEQERALRELDQWLLKQDWYLTTWRQLRKHVRIHMLLPPAPGSLFEAANRWSTHPVLPTLPPTLPDFIADRYLRIEMDGGLAETWSPSIPTSQSYQYRFQCRVMTSGLQHDTAVVELVFQSSSGDEIESRVLTRVGGTTPWQNYVLDQIRPPQGSTRMFVRFRIEGGGDGLQDIRGQIGFDDVRIDQFPQLRIATDQPRGIYRLGQPVEVTARVMGIARRDFGVRFRLLDYRGQELATKLVPIARDVLQFGPDHGASNAVDPLSQAADGQDVLVSWDPPRLPPGYFRFTASLEDQTTTSLATETSIAVVDRLVESPPRGPFGWTMTGKTMNGLGPNQLIDPDGSPAELVRWLESLGVAWVKVPCWLAPDQLERAEALTTLFRKLQDAGIQIVGMLDVPPDAQLPLYDLRGPDDRVAAQLFRDMRDDAVWRDQLEPIMTRLTLKCRDWQLGADRDHSFLGRSRLRESVKTISGGLQGFGQPIDVAVSWPWLEPSLPVDDVSWQAVSRSAEPALTAGELDQALASEQDNRSGGPRTWLLLDPIDRQTYSLDDRIRDLVLRMATVRRHRVEATFVSHPQDPDHGLLRPDGRPSELLLPWRTTNRLIGNLRQSGSLDLRSGAENAVFADDDRAVMMVWADRPTEELMYLGEDVRHVDVWGRSTELPMEQSGGHLVHRIPIGRTPSFLVGIDPMLMAFRMSVTLQPRQLDSLLNIGQNVQVDFANPTSTSLLGRIHVQVPQNWRIDQPTRTWDLLPERKTYEQYEVTLGNMATVGDYEIPIWFRFQTTPPREITVHRRLRIGPEGLELDAESRMRGSEMIIQLEVTNSSPRPFTYQFFLFPREGRKDERRTVTVTPGKTVKTFFSLPNAEDLLGKPMLLHAREQDADRVLNYIIVGRR